MKAQMKMLTTSIWRVHEAKSDFRMGRYNNKLLWPTKPFTICVQVILDSFFKLTARTVWRIGDDSTSFRNLRRRYASFRSLHAP